MDGNGNNPRSACHIRQYGNNIPHLFATQSLTLGRACSSASRRSKPGDVCTTPPAKACILTYAFATFASSVQSCH
jgi:hypothetical protein